MTSVDYNEIHSKIAEALPLSTMRLRRSLYDVMDFMLDYPLTPEELAEYLRHGDDAQVQPLINFVLAALEAKSDVIEPDTDTTPSSKERLDWVLSQLGIAELKELVVDRIPQAEPIVIVEENFREWYTDDREQKNPNYWNDYVRVLSRNGWDAESIATVGDQARQVLRRLEDPTAEHYRSTRGLVVGYVQSGKTANFSAVTAKAIDAGYRLVIILAGTLKNLREQTQRRLDKEIFGREAILDGRDKDELTPRDIKSEVYFEGDLEWETPWNERGGTFLSHGAGYGQNGFPKLHRLTTSKNDYLSASGANPIVVLHADKDLPLHAAANLDKTPCLVAVVKKNSKVLEKLNADLKRADVKDLPALIIDDESDQASINTNNQKEDEEKKRTAINHEITRMLKILPRAQYVGYTATPFANVFVDPSDPEDLYPRHFVLMLNEPPAYRGAKWFHDRADFQGIPDEEVTVADSRSKAFIRDLMDEDDTDKFLEERESELQEALDAFVLTGAIKKYRQAKKPGLRFKHHTMLVHESLYNSGHGPTVTALREMWNTRNYALGYADTELKFLFDSQFKPVMDVPRYNQGFPVPESFEELKPFIAEACAEMVRDSSEDMDGNKTPVLQVDSEGKDSPNFEMGGVWKVMVGGAKLSRGYTVEGLTISYFRRQARSADTLMQTGRWFGFRKGFQDLVRLYAPPSLVEMFEGAMHDEEVFRQNVKAYMDEDDNGKPYLTPMQLGLLVQQTLPHLKPTSRNKMFNAVLVKAACGPKVKEFNSIPERSERAALAANFKNVGLPLLRHLVNENRRIAYFRMEGMRSGNYKAYAGAINGYVGTIPSTTFVDLLDAMEWSKENGYKENNVNPIIRYLRDLIGNGKHADLHRSDFAEVGIVLPAPAGSDKKELTKDYITVPGINFKVPLIRRSRREREGRSDLTGLDPKLAYVVESVAAGQFTTELTDEDLYYVDDPDAVRAKLDDLTEPFDMSPEIIDRRGALALTLIDDRDPAVLEKIKESGVWVEPDFEKGEVGVAFGFNSPHAPLRLNSKVVEWTVRVPGNSEEDTPITIDADEAKASESGK